MDKRIDFNPFHNCVNLTHTPSLPISNESDVSIMLSGCPVVTSLPHFSIPIELEKHCFEKICKEINLVSEDLIL